MTKKEYGREFKIVQKNKTATTINSMHTHESLIVITDITLLLDIQQTI